MPVIMADVKTYGIGIHGDENPKNFQLYLGLEDSGKTIATESIISLSRRMPTQTEDELLTPLVGTMLVHAVRKLPGLADLDVHPHLLDITVVNQKDMRSTILSAVRIARRAMGARRRAMIGFVYLFENDKHGRPWLEPLIDELFGPKGARYT